MVNHLVNFGLTSPLTTPPKKSIFGLHLPDGQKLDHKQQLKLSRVCLIGWEYLLIHINIKNFDYSTDKTFICLFYPYLAIMGS